MLSIVDPAPYAALQVIEDGYMLHTLTTEGWKLLQVLTESRLVEAQDEVVNPRDQYGNTHRDQVKKHHVVTVTKYMLGLTIDETRDQLLAALATATKCAEKAEAEVRPVQKLLEEANKALIELKKNLETSSYELTDMNRKYNTVMADRQKLDADLRKIRVAIGERSMTEILA